MSLGARKLRVTTENGSVYIIDERLMRWSQVKKTGKSGKHRSKSANIVKVHSLELGEPMVIEDDDILPGHEQHFLHTSYVVKIEDIR